MKAQTFIDKRSIFLRRKSGNGARSRQKRSLKSWLVEFVLTRKKVCAHDKKGFTSREKRFQLVMKKVYAHDSKSCKRAESLKESRAGPHVVRTLCKKRRSVAKKSDFCRTNVKHCSPYHTVSSRRGKALYFRKSSLSSHS